MRDSATQLESNGKSTHPAALSLAGAMPLRVEQGLAFDLFNPALIREIAAYHSASPGNASLSADCLAS
jgi:hypothetical protein